MKKELKQFVLAALIAFSLVGLVVYCGERAIMNVTVASTPLVSGESLPPEFTTLVVSDGIGRTAQIRGTYRQGGREVRFIAMRGAPISVLERMSGADAFEVDACFLTEDGRALVTVAGGHEVMIPECRGVSNEEAEISPTSFEEMLLAHVAMQAIAKLHFKSQYELEQRALTRTLAFGEAPVDIIGSTLDRVLADKPHEQATGEVIVGPEEMEVGRGIRLPE